jgi:hypothetical protein
MLNFLNAFSYTNGEDFPETEAKNSTAGNTRDGTHFNKLFAGDIWGFFQAVLSQAGLTPSGNVDKFDDSQILDGLKSVTASNAVTANTYKWSGSANMTTFDDLKVSNFRNANFVGFKTFEDVNTIHYDGFLSLEARISIQGDALYAGTDAEARLIVHFFELDETTPPPFSFAGFQGNPTIPAWGTTEGGTGNFQLSQSPAFQFAGTLARIMCAFNEYDPQPKGEFVMFPKVDTQTAQVNGFRVPCGIVVQKP